MRTIGILALGLAVLQCSRQPPATSRRTDSPTVAVGATDDAAGRLAILNPSPGQTVPWRQPLIIITQVEPALPLRQIIVSCNDRTIATGSTSPFRATFTPNEQGRYVVSATAELASGRTLVAIPVSFVAAMSPDSEVELSDTGVLPLLLGTREPIVMIVAPASAAVLDRRSPVRITAAVANAEPALVELLIDGRVIVTQRELPYETVWEHPQPGKHTLLARMVDINGNRTASKAIDVVVK